MSDYVSAGLASEIMQQLLEVIAETVALGDALDSLQARYNETRTLATQALSLLAAFPGESVQADDWGYYCIVCGGDDKGWRKEFLHSPGCAVLAARALLDSPEAKRLLDAIVEADRGQLIDVAEEEGE